MQKPHYQDHRRQRPPTSASLDNSQPALSLDKRCRRRSELIKSQHHVAPLSAHPDPVAQLRHASEALLLLLGLLANTDAGKLSLIPCDAPLAVEARALHLLFTDHIECIII